MSRQLAPEEELEEIRVFLMGWACKVEIDGAHGTPAAMLQTGRSLVEVLRAVYGAEIEHEKVVRARELAEAEDDYAKAAAACKELAEEKAELQGRLDEMDRRRASWARRAEAAERSLEELVFKNHDLAHERAVDLERRVQRALAAIEGDER
jgi:predicted RNase H-like nuclease (RuvC/YqgF family)